MFICVGDTLIKFLLNVILIKDILYSYGTCVKIFSFNSHDSKILGGEKKPSFFPFYRWEIKSQKSEVSDSRSIVTK